MNKNHLEATALAREIAEGLDKFASAAEVVLLPPFTSIPAVAEVLKGSRIAIGAQDLFTHDSGAFTGEISGPMLRALGCSYVLVGHSERRHVIGESGELVAGKLRAALRNDIAPILCVGELLEERESGKATEIVFEQLSEALSGLSDNELFRVVIAYEPVWAIGTGKTATPKDASEMHASMRRFIAERHGEKAASAVPILYGGSVKPEGATSLLSEPQIDGLLVGGASLEAKSFLSIIPR